MCTKNGGTLEWKCLAEKSPAAPAARASQSSAYYKGKLYIFGGMDEDNTKFCDLWELDLQTETWKEIHLPDGSPMPGPRSGHSASIFKNKMYIFGGILELTKELNEMLIYDFDKCCF
jgi:host cell factor